MDISFKKLTVGHRYNRRDLAKLWGYRSFNAIARGAVTPSQTHYIILFITKHKQSVFPQYQDNLEGDILSIEGETNHQADRRLIDAQERGDEIHLFYREHHRNPLFEYKGQIYLVHYELRKAQPSHFEFSLSLEVMNQKQNIETELRTHGAEIEALITEEEGQRKIKQHIVYERSPKNRARALKLHGCSCLVCGFNFDRFYQSKHAAGYIEIHHTTSVSKGPYRPDLEQDLIPLCSNCHSMAHRRRGQSLNLEELRALIRRDISENNL